MFLGKKGIQSNKVQSAIIKVLGKQTKEPIITPKFSKSKPLKSNKTKNANVNNIFNTRNNSGSNARLKRTTKPKPLIKKYNSKDIDINNKKQFNEIYSQYKRKYQTKNGSIVVDSDEIKKMFSDYDELHPELVHEPSSALSKEIFKQILKENPTKKVIFTAGGGASGKSEIVKGILKEGPAIVFDGTASNYKSLMEKIKQAQNAGKEIEIDGVITDFYNAVKYNNLRERVVSLAELKRNHLGSRNTMLRLVQENPDIKLKLSYNTGQLKSNGEKYIIEIDKDKVEKFLKNRQKLEK